MRHLCFPIGDLYRFMDVDDPDLKLILDAFGIKVPAKLYRRAELKAIKTAVSYSSAGNTPPREARISILEKLSSVLPV